MPMPVCLADASHSPLRDPPFRRSWRRRRFGTRARALEEQRAAIGKVDVAAHRAMRAVARLVAVDSELRADRNGGFRNPAAHQRIGAAALDHPGGALALLVLYVDVNPGMRVDELDLGDRAREGDGPVDVEFGGEGMMCLQIAGQRQQRTTGQNDVLDGAHGRPPRLGPCAALFYETRYAWVSFFATRREPECNFASALSMLEIVLARQRVTLCAITKVRVFPGGNVLAV